MPITLGHREANVLDRLNKLLDRFFPLYVLSVIGLGLLFHRFGSAYATWVVPVLAIQMFLMALNVRLQALINAFRQPKYLLCWVFLSWGVLPAISFILGKLFLSDAPEFAAGLVLTTAIPAAVTASIWTGLSYGNLPLALSIIGAASILSGVMTPLVLKTWVGVLVQLDVQELFGGFLLSVMLPTIAGVLVHEGAGDRLRQLGPFLRLLSKVLIAIVLFINASIIQPQLLTWGWDAAKVVALVVLQAVIAYTGAYVMGRRLRSATLEDVVALTYTVGMRNNSAGIAIGTTFFGPVVAAPVILSVLIQQPLASLVHRYLFLRNRTEQQLTKQSEETSISA
jgi:BASS family bile acid:Na+ symporter